MKTGSLDLPPIARPAPARGRCGALAVSLGLVALLRLDAAHADDRFIAPAGADGWAIQVELAPEPGSESDPWRARTFALGFSQGLSPRGPIEMVPVRWLDGFQEQASHLGMALRGMPGSSTDGVYAFGLTGLVRSVAAHSFGILANPGQAGAERGEHFVSSPQPADRKAGAGGPIVGVTPGVDRLKAPLASPRPCPSEICFGRELVGWHKSLGACTRDVRIGLIDTSFDIAHPTFKKLKAVRKEFLDDVKPSDDDWHGTAILSLLAGDPDSGTPGLVPDATFLLATAFRSDAAGNASTDTGRLLEALEWLDKLDVDVVNMSFAGPPDPAVARAIERMSLKGVVFIAAAGNMGPAAAPSYPAAYPHVIAVTAINRNGDSYRNANRGSYIDIAAPGVHILTALPNGKQGFQTGTSFAAPFVTAILATRVSSGIIEGTEQHLLEQLSVRDLGPPGRDPIYGVGLALAPKQCPQNADVVAQAPAPSGSWGARTKLIRAGAVMRQN